MPFRNRVATSLARQHGLLRAGEELLDGGVGDIGGLYVNAQDRPFGRPAAMLGVTAEQVLVGGRDVDLAADLLMVCVAEWAQQWRGVVVSWIAEGSSVALLWRATSEADSHRIVESIERQRSAVRATASPDAVAAIDEAWRQIQLTLNARQKAEQEAHSRLRASAEKYEPPREPPPRSVSPHPLE